MSSRRAYLYSSCYFRGLDMSPYSYPESLGDKAIYDLHAVCTHLGSMDFGHYVTYAKPYSPEELDTLGWTNNDGEYL